MNIVMTGRRKLSIYSVPNLFQKLEQKNLIHTGVIMIPEVIERETYNRLYEHQNSLNGNYWINFKKEYKLKFQFLENLEDIDVSDDTICLWFFRERPDTAEYRKYCIQKNLTPYKDFADLIIDGNKLKYETNTILITNKKLDILENKFVIRRPCVQINLKSINVTTRKKIKQMLSRNLG